MNLQTNKAYNNTFSINSISCSADRLVVAKIFVLLLNICGKNPTHRKSANNYSLILRKRVLTYKD